MTKKEILPEGALEEALQKTSNEDWEFYGFNEDWLEDAANNPLFNGTVLSLVLPIMEDPMREKENFFQTYTHMLQ